PFCEVLWTYLGKHLVEFLKLRLAGAKEVQSFTRNMFLSTCAFYRNMHLIATKSRGDVCLFVLDEERANPKTLSMRKKLEEALGKRFTITKKANEAAILLFLIDESWKEAAFDRGTDNWKKAHV